MPRNRSDAAAARVNTRRLAALHRERAEVLARLVELEREMAAALVEGDAPANETTPAATKRARAVKQTQIVVPRGVEVSELDRARAKQSLRRVGFRPAR